MIITTEDTEEENQKGSSCLPNALSRWERVGVRALGSTANKSSLLFLFFATLRALTLALSQRERE